MAWRMDRDGAAIFEAMSPDDIANRDEEIAFLDQKQKPWKMVNGLIEGSVAANQRAWKGVLGELQAQGALTALNGFTGLELTPASGTIATATILTTEVAMWSTPTYTPIAANPQAPKAYILRSFGVSTTAASQGTMAFNMRMGQLITSPLIGASVAAAQTASQTTTLFRLEGDVLIRRGGDGTNKGAATACFRYTQGTATTSGSAELTVMGQIFGTTAEVAVETDAALANGLWPGAIATTSTTNTFVPLGIIWASWN